MTSVTGPFPQLNECVESQSLFFKTDAKVLSEVPDHPKRILEQETHWPTGTVSLVTIAIKPHLVAQTHMECPCLYVCFVGYEYIWTCARQGEMWLYALFTWNLAKHSLNSLRNWMGIDTSAPQSGALMPFIYVYLCPPCVSLFSDLCLSSITTSSSALPPLHYPPPCTFVSVLSLQSHPLPPLAFPPFLSVAVLPFSKLLFSQGLFGRCTLCVSSRRRGERERNHL